MDLGLQLQQVQLLAEQDAHLLQALLRVNRFQDILLLGHRQLQAGADQVSQPARLVHVHGRDVGVFRERLTGPHALLKQRHHGAHQRLDRHALLGALGDRLNPRHQKRLGLGVAQHTHAALPLHQHTGVAVGHLEHPPDNCLDAQRIEVIGFDGLFLTILLRHHQQPLVRRVGVLDGAQRGIAADIERRDDVGVDHGVDQRQHGQIICTRRGRAGGGSGGLAATRHLWCLLHVGRIHPRILAHVQPPPCRAAYQSATPHI